MIAFQRGLAIDSTHVPTLYNLAAAQHAGGDDKASLKTLDQLLAAAPGFPPAVESRKRTRERLGLSD